MIASSAHHHHSPVFGSHPESLATPDGGEGLPVLELGLDVVLVGIGRTIIQNGWE